jgi:hypothetical protein
VIIPIARLTYIGVKKLGFKEKEIGWMTLGKFMKLYREYKNDFDQEMLMIAKHIRYCDLESSSSTLDDAVPF